MNIVLCIGILCSVFGAMESSQCILINPALQLYSSSTHIYIQYWHNDIQYSSVNYSSLAIEVTCSTTKPPTINVIKRYYGNRATIMCGVGNDKCVNFSAKVTFENHTMTLENSQVYCIMSNSVHYTLPYFVDQTHVQIHFDGYGADRIAYWINKSNIMESAPIINNRATISLEYDPTERINVTYTTVTNNVVNNVTNYITFTAPPNKPIDVWVAYNSRDTVLIYWRTKPQKQLININQFVTYCKNRNGSILEYSSCNATKLILKFRQFQSNSAHYRCSIRGVSKGKTVLDAHYYHNYYSNPDVATFFLINPNVTIDTHMLNLPSQIVVQNSSTAMVSLSLKSPYDYGLVGVMISVNKSNQCLSIILLNCSDCSVSNSNVLIDNFRYHVCGNKSRYTFHSKQYVRNVTPIYLIAGGNNNTILKSSEPLTRYGFCAYPIYVGGIGKPQCLALDVLVRANMHISLNSTQFDRITISWKQPNVTNQQPFPHAVFVKKQTTCGYNFVIFHNASVQRHVDALKVWTGCTRRNISSFSFHESTYLAVIDGLAQHTFYTLSIYPISSNGIGDQASINATTAINLPGQPLIKQLYRNTPTTLVVVWNEPNDANISERITSYEISVSTKNRSTLNKAIQDIEIRSLVISGLLPCTLYNVKIRVNTSEGFGAYSDVMEKSTQSTKPGACTQLHFIQASATSMTATWEPPENTTCPIVYDVSIIEVATSVALQASSTVDTTMLFVGLSPFTEYSFQVRAYVDGVNKGSFGPISLPSRTHEARPDAPQSLSCHQCSNCDQSVIYNTINCIWEAPLHPNGIITKYTLTITSDINNKSISVDTGPFKRTITNIDVIQPDKNLSVSITAQNGAGSGAKAHINIVIESGPPKMVITPAQVVTEMRRVNVTYNLTSQIPVRLPVSAFSATQGRVTGFHLVIAEAGLIREIALSGNSSIVEKSWRTSNRGHTAPYRLFTAPYLPPTNRRRRDTSDPAVILVGESQDCENQSNINLYCNGPLRSGTEYAVAARAFTTNSFVTAGVVMVTTSMTPYEARLLQCGHCQECEDGVKDNTIVCTWNEPLMPRGNITAYLIIISFSDIHPTEPILSMVLDKNTLNVTITDNCTILPDLRYTVRIIASNEAGPVNAAAVNITMKSHLPDHAKYDPEVQAEIVRDLPTPADTTSQIAVRMPHKTPARIFGEVVEGFNLVVVEKQLQARVHQNGLVLEDVKTWATSDIGRIAPYKVFGSLYRTISTRVRRETSSRNDASIVIVGEDSACAKDDLTSYCNGRLRSGVEYQIYVRAYTKTTYNTLASIVVTTTVPAPSQQIPVHVIAVVTVAAVIIMVISIMIIVMCRRRWNNRRTSERPNTASTEWLLKAVRALEFGQYYTGITAESNVRLYKQFQHLQDLVHSDTAGFVSSLAKHDINIRKNRYKDILPFNHQRVKLICINDNGGDFINASYVSGIDHSCEYIAAQTPLTYGERGTSTINDFWQMVWQQKCIVIVTLSDPNYTSRRKGVVYWPEKAQKFGQILVEIENETYRSFYYVRSFHCCDFNSSEDRRIYQFHYPSWHDHQAPNVAEMIEFTNAIRKCVNSHRRVPVLIHCDDGSDRTGTFIALDRVLRECVAIDSTIRIAAWIHEMRLCRIGMVGSFVNYKFLHDCALQHVIYLLSTAANAGRYDETRSYVRPMSNNASRYYSEDGIDGGMKTLTDDNGNTIY